MVREDFVELSCRYSSHKVLNMVEVSRMLMLRVRSTRYVNNIN